MAMDAGTVQGTFTLDTSGFTDGVKAMQQALEAFDSTSETSFGDIEKYAQTLMDVMSTAYQSVAQNSTVAQAAQEAYNAVIQANKNTLDEYARAVTEAETRNAQAKEIVVQKQREYNQALEIANAQLQRYNELKEKEGVNQRALQANSDKYVRDLQVAEQARQALNAATKDATASENALLKAKEKYESVAKNADTAALKAQQQIEKANTDTAKSILNNATALEKAAIAAEGKIQTATIQAMEKSYTAKATAELKYNTDIEKQRIASAEKMAEFEKKLHQQTLDKRKELKDQQIARLEKIESDSNAKIEKAKIDAAQRSADKVKEIESKAELSREKMVLDAETKIQQTKIQEAEKGARQAAQIEAKERQQATRDAQREQERAAQEISDKQVMAFAVAAKAVDEVVNGVKRLAQEMLELSKQVVDIGANFETSMAQVAATSGMTATDVSSRISEYQDLVDAAKEAGLTTIYSASEAGEALNYLALAGYNVEQSIATMPDILTIAAAGAMDLGRASDMVTDAMNALDLNIEDTTDFIDKMAKTAQSSNTNVEQLGGAILTVGGTATVLAGGVTELDTALGLLANSGIKARVGGTALRQILLNLTAPAKQGAEMIEQLGLEVFDLEGNMRPLKDIFTDLNDILSDFSDQQRMEALNAIFDKRQIRAANALMQATGEKWEILENKINNAQGAAEKMAETMRSNLNGALNLAKSNLENLAITLYDGIVKNITDLVKEAIPKLQELNKVLASPEVQARLKDISAKLKEVGLNLLDKIVALIPDVIKFLSDAEVHVQSLAIALSGLIVAFNAQKIIDGLVGIAGALGKVIQFVAQNPYAALAIAMAEVVALAIELDNSFTQQYKDMAAQVREETDLWEKQRAAVEGVTNEWNSYLDTQDDVVRDAETHAEAVQTLYYRYMNLKESGKDATLALEALKDEVPELQAMLEDGKDSFEDITKAVDDYTEALLRSAKAEAGKNLYIQAAETQAKAQTAYKDATDAVQENEKALKEAEKAVESYSAKFDDPNFAWDVDELEKLKETRDALSETLEENKAAQESAKNTLDSATKAMEQAEADYTEYVRGEAHARGEILIGEAEGAKAAGEAYAKERRQAAMKAAGADRKTIEDALKLFDKYDKEVNARQMSESEKFDLISMWFTDHPDWNIYDEDLNKWYDKLLDYREKVAKDMQTQADKNAKEAEKKAKEDANNLKKTIEAGVSDIDYFAGLRGDTADKQSQALRDYVDLHIDYYKKNPEEYKKMVQKIASLDKTYLTDTKTTVEEAKKYLGSIKEFYGTDFKDAYDALENMPGTVDPKKAEDAAKKYVKAWEKGYDDLLKRATKAYDALEKKREKFEDNLLKGVELYSQGTKKVWNRFTSSYEEDKTMQVSSKEMKKQLKEIEKYNETIEKLRAKNVDESLIDEILGMDTEKGMEFATALNKMSTKELNAYVDAYKQVHEKTDAMTSAYYQKELEKFDQEYMQPLKAYVSGDQSELKKAYETLGEDSVEGYLDGLKQKADEAEGQTKKIYEDAYNSVKEVLGIHSPSTKYYEIGEYVIEGFLNGVQSKAEQLASIFLSLGQKAGDSFVSAFKETWENFVSLWNTMGVSMPQAMIATASPAFAGNQTVYNSLAPTYTGLTKEDVVAAVKEALPSGDVTLTIDQTEFARVSRNALNSLAENSEMGLNV